MTAPKTNLIAENIFPAAKIANSKAKSSAHLPNIFVWAGPGYYEGPHRTKIIRFGEAGLLVSEPSVSFSELSGGFRR